MIMSGSSKFFFIVSGIVSIILGIFLLLNPVINLMAFAWLFSIIFFVSAVSSIINYFMLPPELRSGWYLISGIINLIVADLNHRLEDKQLSIELSPDAEQFIVDNAYDPIYGARPLKRYIQKYVETLSAKLILADQVQMGDTILIAVENGELVAKKKQQ